jgi:hypothetical protein
LQRFIFRELGLDKPAQTPTRKGKRSTKVVDDSDDDEDLEEGKKDDSASATFAYVTSWMNRNYRELGKTFDTPEWNR